MVLLQGWKIFVLPQMSFVLRNYLQVGVTQAYSVPNWNKYTARYFSSNGEFIQIQLRIAIWSGQLRGATWKSALRKEGRCLYREERN